MRPLTEDWAYADRLCDAYNITDPEKRQIKAKSLYRMVVRLGGAKKLKALSDEARILLIKPARVQVARTGLAERGFTCQKPINHKGLVEEVIQIRLRRRGLHG